MTAAAIDQQKPATKPPRQPIHSPLTLRELFAPVFHHRLLVVVAFMLPVALAILAAVMARPVYIADSRLLILLGNEYVFHSDSDATPGLSFDRAQIVQAEMEILAAKDLHRRAIEEVGLKRVYPSLASTPHGLELATERFEKDITIQNVPQSNAVDLTLRNHNPVIAAELLNELIDLYIEHRPEIFQQVDPARIDRERDQLKQRLALIDGQIAQFASDQNFGDYDQAVAAAQTEQASASSELRSLGEQYAIRRGRTAHLDHSVDHAPVSLVLYSDHARSQQINDLTNSLLALQTQRREAAAKYADGYPLVVDLDRRILTLQTQIATAPQQQVATVRVGVNPVHQTLDAELADSESDMAGLKQGLQQAGYALQAANDRVRELTEIEPQYRQLVRDRSVIESTYSDLAKRAEDTRVQDTLSRARANVRVIQRANPPVKGKAGRVLLLGAGVLLGCASAAAAVLLAAAFSEEMNTPRDVEQKLDLPTILSIPLRAKPGGQKTPGVKDQEDVRLSLDDSELLLRLASSLTEKSGQIIQFIATDDGAGVSSLALSLALQAANQGARRVLLVDVEPPEGRSAGSRLEAAGAVLKPQPGKRVIPVDGTTLSVSRPIGTKDLRVDEQQWEGVLSRARNGYDVIIIDSPAISRSAAGIVIAPFVDMTLLVVEAEKTRAAVARNLIDRIDATGGQVIGVVLNKRQFHIPRAIYSRL